MWNVVVNGQVVSRWLVESAADAAALNLRHAGWGMAYVEFLGEFVELLVVECPVPVAVGHQHLRDEFYVVSQPPERGRVLLRLVVVGHAPEDGGVDGAYRAAHGPRPGVLVLGPGTRRPFLPGPRSSGPGVPCGSRLQPRVEREAGSQAPDRLPERRRILRAGDRGKWCAGRGVDLPTDGGGAGWYAP
jgi:hypothetical protein